MIQRRAIIGVVLLAAIPVLTGCGLEVKDETSREQSPVQATDVSVGAIDVRDAFVTYNTPVTQSSTAPLSTPSPAAIKSGDAYVVVTLVNNGRQPDALTGVTSPLGSVTVSGGATTVPLPPGVPVAFGAPELGGTGPMLDIATGGIPAPEGSDVQVQFSFANAGSKTVSLPIVESDDDTTVPTQAVPTPTTTQTLPSEGLQPASD